MHSLQDLPSHQLPRRAKAKQRTGRGASKEEDQNHSSNPNLNYFVLLSCLLSLGVWLRAPRSVLQGTPVLFLVPQRPSSFVVHGINRFHPHISTTLYTIVNTSPPRTRKTKSAPRPAFVVKWTIPIDLNDEWEIRVRKVGEKGVTCFDVRCLICFLPWEGDK